jgi:hypothetical protein
MSIRRMLTLIRWQLRQGWRSPYFVLAIIYPFVLTAVVRLVFAPVFVEEARLVILAPAGSVVAKGLREHPGIVLSIAADGRAGRRAGGRRVDRRPRLRGRAARRRAPADPTAILRCELG